LLEQSILLEVGRDEGCALVGVLRGEVSADRTTFIEDKSVVILRQGQKPFTRTREMKGDLDARCKGFGRTAGFARTEATCARLS
jgi:hypothetical protein